MNFRIKIKMSLLVVIFPIIIGTSIAQINLDNYDVKDFEFDTDPEIMIAQESRQYQTIVKPPFTPKAIKIYKPSGITNSHRPQYNVDSEEDFDLPDQELVEFLETTTRKSLEKSYQPAYKIRAKEVMIREAVLRALERKDHVGKFAQILPIIRSMSGSQRVALASLVASQVGTPPGKSPLNLSQVRSMFGTTENSTSELMLPILLDTANMIRKAVGPGKELREVKQPQIAKHPQMLRRSFIEDDDAFDNDPFETSFGDTSTSTTTKTPKTNNNINRLRSRMRNRGSQSTTERTVVTDENIIYTDTNSDPYDITDDTDDRITYTVRSSSSTSTTSTAAPTSSSVSSIPSSSSKPLSSSLNASKSSDNGTIDLMADSTNHTLSQDVPVAEKLRSFNRYVDRKGNVIRRGNFQKPAPSTRRTTAEPSMSPIAARRRPQPSRKMPNSSNADGKCELFTNSLCLHTEDYPTDAIVQSIRRNKAAAGALLADFRDPEEGAVDGVTAAQEAKYTAEHYFISNRRGDTANRDFAGAGEAGFMCPSTVKYARPQRARATSGQWKYIVNTGEHTQTLRLEKCLKPKESCTYLTDNFKSKCVQVYNYHRLLTWDQQNGLHMDIFKVPTCCSCHIEGYSVSFPPLGHRVQETSSEHFPGEDLSSEHGNGAFENVQQSLQRPIIAKNPPFLLKPLETFPAIGEKHNLISGGGFPKASLDDSDNISPTNPMDSYGNSYFPDSFNQASSIKNVKRPLHGRNPTGTKFDSATLPSFLEPPTQSATSSFSFVKEPPSKYKITNSNQFKRGAPRPSRRPMRKKISGVPDDMMSSGTAAVDSFTSSTLDTLEDFNDDLEEPEINKSTLKKATIAPKLPAIELTSTKRPEQRRPVKKDNEPLNHNSKRVNYNYHPIIDFFDEDKADESIDREDVSATYVPAIQSDWQPIDHPVQQNNQNINLAGRKKH